MQNTCELVAEQLLQHRAGDCDKKQIETDECINLLRNAEAQIAKAVRLSDDLVQLGRLDQGAELVTNKAVIDLASWGEEVLYASFTDTDAAMKDRPLSLEITPVIIGDRNSSDYSCDGGPAKIYSDPSVLNRVLTALLEHARNVNDYKTRDVVSLRIGYQNGGRCTFEVIFKVDTKTCDADDGYNSSAGTTSSNQNFSVGKFPPIFQRYHQEYIPDETMEVDFETAASLRESIACHVNSFKDNNLGISLSLAYFLVQGLGSELRYALQPNGTTKFWFVLPKQDLPDGVECSKLLPKMLVCPNEESTTTIPEMKLDPVPALNDSSQNASSESKATWSAVAPSIPTKEPTGPPGFIAYSNNVSSTPLLAAPSSSINNSRKRSGAPLFILSHAMNPIKLRKEEPITIDVSKSEVACKGLKSMDPPHVLIVEDTAMCAKLLRMMLSKFHCTSETVENGRFAVDKLRNAAPGEYNLVLMDLRMPVMDGLTATKILKQEMKLTVPIVALTAETTASIRTECEEIGFEDFYSKPLKRDGLKDVLLKHTGYHVV
jgi:CheY-like chemotaxis protein